MPQFTPEELRVIENTKFKLENPFFLDGGEWGDTEALQWGAKREIERLLRELGLGEIADLWKKVR